MDWLHRQKKNANLWIKGLWGIQYPSLPQLLKSKLKTEEKKKNPEKKKTVNVKLAKYPVQAVNIKAHEMIILQQIVTITYTWKIVYNITVHSSVI